MGFTSVSETIFALECRSGVVAWLRRPGWEVSEQGAPSAPCSRSSWSTFSLLSRESSSAGELKTLLVPPENGGLCERTLMNPVNWQEPIF